MEPALKPFVLWFWCYSNNSMEYEGPHDLNNLPPEERERIINEIIEQVIKPQLEDMGAMFQDAEGEAFVFGSSDKDQAEETIQKLMTCYKTVSTLITFTRDD